MPDLKVKWYGTQTYECVGYLHRVCIQFIGFVRRLWSMSGCFFLGEALYRSSFDVVCISLHGKDT